jgi:hypothetical protein
LRQQERERVSAVGSTMYFAMSLVKSSSEIFCRHAVDTHRYRRLYSQPFAPPQDERGFGSSKPKMRIWQPQTTTKRSGGSVERRFLRSKTRNSCALID